jgi:hypothetical protein
LVDGDIAFDADGRDLRVAATALDALLQGLTARVLTPFGTDVFNTTYGLDVAGAFTQPVTRRVFKQVLTLNLVRTLGTDPRVKDVVDVVFEDDPRYLQLHPGLTAEDVRADLVRRLWKVDVILETMDGQTTTLSLNLGA